MHSAVPAPADNPLKGIILVAMAVLLFALSDVVTKHLTMHYAVTPVIAIRYLASIVLILLVLWPQQRARLWQTQRTGLVLLRGLFLAMASLTMGLALRVMPLGETIAIMYVYPFVVALLSIPLLGERVSLSGWIGVIAGFSGVLLIVRPGNAFDNWGVVFTLMNASMATAYIIMTRILGRSESTSAMMFHATLVGAVVFTIGTLSSDALSTFRPGSTDLGLMVLLGALTTGGHFMVTAAYRMAPPSLLAPVNYLHLVWAGLLGWLFFDHIPDQWSLWGMALVCTAGLVITLRSRFTRTYAKSGGFS